MFLFLLLLEVVVVAVDARKFSEHRGPQLGPNIVGPLVYGSPKHDTSFTKKDPLQDLASRELCYLRFATVK